MGLSTSPAGSGASGAALGISVRDFGARGDARKVTDGVLMSTSATVTSATAAFTAADVGKSICGVEPSNGGRYLPFGTITAVNSATSVTVSEAATGSTGTAVLVIGTDDSDAIIAAKEAAVVQNRALIIPAGGYLVRKRILGFSFAAQTRAPNVAGEGSGQTIIYVAADFDYTGVATYSVLVGGNLGNAIGGEWSGITFDGCGGLFEHPGGGANDLIHPICGTSHARLHDVRVVDFKNLIYGLLFNGNCVMSHCHVEAVGAEASVGWNGEGTIFHSYMGNSPGMALKISFVTANGPWKMFGGIIDEVSGSQSVLVTSSSVDVHFIGTILYAGLQRIALKVADSSSVRLTNAMLTPFGSHDATALRVDSGCAARATNVRFKGQGTGYYAIDNAGTVIDALGNEFTGALNGTAPVVELDLDHVPTSDPGVPGQVYRATGALMVSV